MVDPTPGGQDRKDATVSAIGCYFDLRMVEQASSSRNCSELKSAGVEICFAGVETSSVRVETYLSGVEIWSVGYPSGCAGEVVDNEVDSGAAVSSLPVCVDADSFPLHETKLSMCGGHHMAARGRKLHGLGARVLGLEAQDVRGNVATLFVRFGVMDTGKALLSTHDIIRKASDTRITLVRKRCAWHLRVKLKPHRVLPCTDDEEFMEVLALDRRAGVRPVQEGGCSDSGLADDVEESAPVKKLVAPSPPAAADRGEHIASVHAVFRNWCRECCIARGRMHQHFP